MCRYAGVSEATALCVATVRGVLPGLLGVSCLPTTLTSPMVANAGLTW